MPNRSSLRTPAELRAKAAWCFRMAAKMPRGIDVDTVKTFGHEYLKMAEKLEALRHDEMPTPRHPGKRLTVDGVIASLIAEAPGWAA